MLSDSDIIFIKWGKTLGQIYLEVHILKILRLEGNAMLEWIVDNVKAFDRAKMLEKARNYTL